MTGVQDGRGFPPYTHEVQSILHLRELPASLLAGPGGRKENYRIVTSTGVIIQRPDGSLQRVSPEEGEAYLQTLDGEKRELYT